VALTALICFVYFIKNSELRRRRFRSIPRNPISYVNTEDFPHDPELLRTGASVKNWSQTDTVCEPYDGTQWDRCSVAWHLANGAIDDTLWALSVGTPVGPVPAATTRR